jgi:hypothetical protein
MKCAKDSAAWNAALDTRQLKPSLRYEDHVHWLAEIIIFFHFAPEMRMVSGPFWNNPGPFKLAPNLSYL